MYSRVTRSDEGIFIRGIEVSGVTIASLDEIVAQIEMLQPVEAGQSIQVGYFVEAQYLQRRGDVCAVNKCGREKASIV